MRSPNLIGVGVCVALLLLQAGCRSAGSEFSADERAALDARVAYLGGYVGALEDVCRELDQPEDTDPRSREWSVLAKRAREMRAELMALTVTTDRNMLFVDREIPDHHYERMKWRLPELGERAKVLRQELAAAMSLNAAR